MVVRFVNTTARDQKKAEEIMKFLENHGIVINYYETLKELKNIDVPILLLGWKDFQPITARWAVIEYGK